MGLPPPQPGSACAIVAAQPDASHASPPLCVKPQLQCNALPPPQEYGSAIEFCSKALEVDPGNFKALLRRTKARIARHDYEAAAADLAALRELDPLCAEVAEQEAALARAKAVDRRKDAATFANMFGRALRGEPES